MFEAVFKDRMNLSVFDLVYTGFVIGAYLEGYYLIALFIFLIGGFASGFAQFKLENNTKPPKP